MTKSNGGGLGCFGLSGKPKVMSVMDGPLNQFLKIGFFAFPLVSGGGTFFKWKGLEGKKRQRKSEAAIRTDSFRALK